MLKPLPAEVRRKTRSKLKKENKKTLLPVKNLKAEEVKYRSEILKILEVLRSQVETELSNILLFYEQEYVLDEYSSVLEKAFERLRATYARLEKKIQSVASDFVSSSYEKNKNKFYNSAKASVGVDLTAIIRNENLEDVLISSTKSNVSLIKSLSEDYLKEIERVVLNNTSRGVEAKKIIAEVLKKADPRGDNKINARAKLIARDQSSKINSVLNQQRQTKLGIEEYVWRTAGDGRTRESHRVKNGKIFRWDSPPADTGHPGEDIQCRCVAQAIIKI